MFDYITIEYMEEILMNKRYTCKVCKTFNNKVKLGKPDSVYKTIVFFVVNQSKINITFSTSHKLLCI